jgi:hypothetical protein
MLVAGSVLIKERETKKREVCKKAKKVKANNNKQKSLF